MLEITYSRNRTYCSFLFVVSVLAIEYCDFELISSVEAPYAVTFIQKAL